MADEVDPESDWDPEPHGREWYSHTRTGERGYFVRRGGKNCIRLDRPMEDISKPFNESEWNPDREHRPMTAAQVAQIAFEADRKLCFYLGLRERSRKEWQSLSDKQRQFWMSKGPNESQRAELYAGVFLAMRPFFR